MAQASVRKAFIKKFGLPTDGAAFLKQFDGNSNALGELSVAVDESGNPEFQEFFQQMIEGSGGGMDGLVASIHSELFPSKSGARNKQPDAKPEKMEGTNLPPTSKADSNTLDATPYESLSDADKKRLAAGGFPKSDVSSWTADDLQLTLNSLDTAASKGKGRGSNKTADAIIQNDARRMASTAPAAAPTPANAPPAAAPAQRPMPVDPNEPIPGAMGITQADIDAANDPVPGPLGALQRYGFTQDDARLYMNPDGMLPAGIMGEPSDPPAMDMSRLAAAAAPTPMPATAVPPAAVPNAPQPNPLGGMSADEMMQALGALDYEPSATPFAAPESLGADGLDLGELLSDGGGRLPPGPDDPTVIPMPSQQVNPWTKMGQSPPPTSEPVTGQDAPGGPYRPVTSRVDAFMKARGLDGMNTGAVTKPIDFMIRNSPWMAPAAAGAYGLNKMFGGSNAPPQATDDDAMRQLEQMRDEARANMEAVFGRMPSPAQPPAQPPRPTGRSL